MATQQNATGTQLEVRSAGRRPGSKRDNEPNGVYAHWVAHNLDLVVNFAVKEVIEMKTFFETMQKIYITFLRVVIKYGINDQLLYLGKKESQIQYN